MSRAPLRLRQVARNGFGSDSDSEYANHPPPTDSEIEPEIDPLYLANNRISGYISEALPGYVTDEMRMNNRSLTRASRSLNSSSTHLRSRINTNPDVVVQQQEQANSNSNILYGIGSSAMENLYKQKNRLKKYGLKRLNARQHIIVTICRDVPIYYILKSFIMILIQWYRLVKNPYDNVVTVRATEFFLASLWSLVSALLSYTILDGFMVRWLVIYAIQAAIIRILSMSLIIVMIIEMVNYTFNNIDNGFCLTVWILVSCILTIIFIVQCFMSNNLLMQEKMKKFEISSVDLSRSGTETQIQTQGSNSFNSSNHSGSSSLNISTNSINNANNNSNNTINNTNNHTGNSGVTRKIDYYNLIVFAVVPIGVASFISTVGLIRLLLILRLDVGMEFSRLQQSLPQ